MLIDLYQKFSLTNISIKALGHQSNFGLIKKVKNSLFRAIWLRNQQKPRPKSRFKFLLAKA